MAALTNITFNEIKVGDTESISRRLSRTEVEALALAGGDVDAFQIADEEESPGELHTEAVGTEALLSALLNRRLPGPGTTIASQDLHFQGSLQAGANLIATVTVREKNPKEELVIFDCSVRSDGQELVNGTVTVRAPTKQVRYADVATPEILIRRTDKYARLIQNAKALPPVKCVVAYPCDRDSLVGPIEAAKLGLIDPILVGPADKIRAVAKAEGVDLSSYRIVSAEHSHAAAEKAVALVRSGEGEALMKGSLHTDALMSAVVSSANGLRTSRRISHVFVMDVPSCPRALAITDAAINIVPTLEDKMHIAQNAIDLAHVLGVAKPKVAILSAVEAINPKIPSTIEAAALCKMADRGQITGAVLDGPLAFDNAISEEAAKTKKISSPVAGKADILLVPDLEAGNMLAKQLQYLAGADAAGIVLGARVPIVLTSRADTVRTRLASIAVMKLIAHSRRAANKPTV